VTDFGGETYDPDRDGPRLRRQLQRVIRCMQDGEWRTLDQISRATGDPPASVSARLRDLRKPQFGSHEVDREYVSRGLWRYRLRMQLRL
jgi:hypothetical protein